MCKIPYKEIFALYLLHASAPKDALISRFKFLQILGHEEYFLNPKINSSSGQKKINFSFTIRLQLVEVCVLRAKNWVILVCQVIVLDTDWCNSTSNLHYNNCDKKYWHYLHIHQFYSTVVCQLLCHIYIYKHVYSTTKYKEPLLKG